MGKRLFFADLTLDQFDSDGRACSSIVISKRRLMALSLKKNSTWYGFVIREADRDEIFPNSMASVEIDFLDTNGASAAFSNGASILFGNGIVSFGFMILKEQQQVKQEQGEATVMVRT